MISALFIPNNLLVLVLIDVENDRSIRNIVEVLQNEIHRLSQENTFLRQYVQTTIVDLQTTIAEQNVTIAGIQFTVANLETRLDNLQKPYDRIKTKEIS